MIPQYLTADDAKQLLQAAQQQGINPAEALKSLTDQGHIVQGVNDTQYNNQLQASSTGQGAPTPPEHPQGFLDDGETGFIHDITTPLRGATKGILDFGANAAKAIGGLFGANTQGITDFQNQNLQANPGIESGFKVAGEVAPSIAAAYATDGLVSPLIEGAGLTGGGAIAAESLAQGVGQFGAGYLGSGGDVKAAAVQGVLGAAAPGVSKYVISPAIDAVAPLLTRTGTDGLGALQGGIKSVDEFSGAAGKEFAAGSKVLDEANPTARLKLDLKDVGKLANVSEKIGLDLENIPANGELTHSEAQNLFTQLNKGKNWMNPEVAPLYDSLRAKASTAFGSEFDNLYSTYASKINAVKALDDVFPRSGTTPLTSSEQQALADKITKLAKDPIGKKALQDVMGNFKELGGADLSSPVKIIAKANKIKSPILKKAFVGSLELLGLSKLGNVAGGVINHFTGQ